RLGSDHARAASVSYLPTRQPGAGHRDPDAATDICLGPAERPQLRPPSDAAAACDRCGRRAREGKRVRCLASAVAAERPRRPTDRVGAEREHRILTTYAALGVFSSLPRRDERVVVRSESRERGNCGAAGSCLIFRQLRFGLNDCQKSLGWDEIAPICPFKEWR